MTTWGPVRRASNLVWLPLILASTYLDRPQLAHPGWSAVCAVVAALAGVVAGLRWEPAPWVQPVAIVVLGASGVAFTAAVGNWSTPVTVCFYAVLLAGIRLPAMAAVAVLVGVAVGAVTVLRAESGSGVLLLVLGLSAMLLLGMGRRESARRAEQRELALVATARVHAEQARSAALAERARIARDVHDVLAHSLSALAVQLQGARLMLVRDGAAPDVLAQVERAQHLATEGLAEARRAVTALRTEPVELGEGLAALVATAPEATLEIDGDPHALPSAARETMLRTAQEALTNARKHAGGAPVSVHLTYSDHATELEVCDRAGARPPRGAGGYGLVGMAERAASVGAALDAGPTDDGWRVWLRMPA